MIGDFGRHLDRIPVEGRRLVAFLGGTIGNLTPMQRRRFFFDLNCTMRANDHFLIGTDLVKDTRRIVAAYDDPGGVTAAFNRNVLVVINRELGADFDVDPVRARRPLERGRAVDRDAPPLATPPGGARPRPRHGGALRGGRGPAHRDQRQVHAPAGLERELERADFVVDAMWGADEGEYLLTLAHPYC